MTGSHEVRRQLCAWAIAVVATAVVARGVCAQDIEMTARTLHRPLPAGYYERVRRNPHMFEWPGAPSAARGIAAAIAAQRAAIPPRSGKLTIAVIPTLFADSPAPTITTQELQRVLFDGPSTYGTIAEAYREYSGGKLQVLGTVVPWVRSGLTLSEALGSDQGFGADARIGDWFTDGIINADALVDFGQFDNNGPDGIPNSGDDNGIVDVAVFLYEERSLPCGGSGPWPQLTGYGAWFPGQNEYFTQDPSRSRAANISISGLIMLSATDCSGANIMTPAILAHELGHTMGLPDLYDASAGLGPETRRWVVGCWDLMGAGAWGCGDGAAPPTATRPSHDGAWSKDRLGWLNVTDVGTVRNQEFVLHAASLSNEALRIRVSPDESYLIEYRERTGFDSQLAGDGVVIWHIDDSPAAPFHQVMVEEADGNHALLRLAAEGGNRGEAGDLFGGIATRFSGATTPASVLHTGLPTTFTVHGVIIDRVAHTARVRLTTDPQVVVSSTPIPIWPALSDDQRVVHVTGGTEPYTIVPAGHLPAGVSLVAVADDVIVRGVPVEAGSFSTTLAVTDARGLSVSQPITFSVSDPVFTLSHLLQPLLTPSGPALPDAERDFLDTFGNRNGRFDVGDLRAWVLAKQPA